MTGRPNVLLITLDQFRADAMSCAGHPLVLTPNLDRLAASGVRFARHYAQAAPCSPGRASLYTGMYQMNHRVVANGTPLDARFDNVALMARRAGYAPALFGYTDQGADPRTIDDPLDPRLSTYEGVLPGFDVETLLVSDHGPWIEWLSSLGYHVTDAFHALRTEHERPVEHSLSSFTTDRLLAWLGGKGKSDSAAPWFAHVSYLRPHPPFSAAGHFASKYDPDHCGDALPIPPDPHPLHSVVLADRRASAPADRRALGKLRAQYFGMISEVDAQLGRVWDHLEASGEWGNTVVVVTADHAEQLGDQGLLGKLGFFESSYHILGIVRDPRRPQAHGTTVNHFTENVDVLPTLCELLGQPIPAQVDGCSLVPFLSGEAPGAWRRAATYEFDWRDVLIQLDPERWPWDARLAECNLAVRRSADRAYVQFGDGSWRCFDLAKDPTWCTQETDPHTVLAEAQDMLVWRSRHLDRTLTGMLLESGGIGRRPV